MRLALLLHVVFHSAKALVEFSNSSLYDIFDFKGWDEVHIPRCDAGCLIFASTLGEDFGGVFGRLDPYASNLLIRFNGSVQNDDLARLAQRTDDNRRKVPLIVQGPSHVDVINMNMPLELSSASSIVLYVVDKARADTLSYDVYDAFYSSSLNYITPAADIVTIMSAKPFTIQAPASAQPNEVTARLAGFDNALDTNTDACPYAYKSPESSSSFAGFSLQVRVPIISFVQGQRHDLQLLPGFGYNEIFDIELDGFVTSPGWNGCTNLQPRGIRSFRTPDDIGTDTYIIRSIEGNFTVTMDVLPNFNANCALDVDDMINDDAPIPIAGTGPQTLHFASTHVAPSCRFSTHGDNQGFLVRYTTTRIVPAPDASSTTAPDDTFPSRSTEIASTSISFSTTSSACRSTGTLLASITFAILISK